MDKYAVMGFPIAHSKSPQIHKLFAEQTGQSLIYEKIEVAAENFDAALDLFFKQGGQGLNITVPLKSLAYQRMHGLDQYAKTANAVNTITLDPQNKRIGYNTDGIGLIKDLTQNHRINLCDRSILVLGAGGAVQGVLKNLLECTPRVLTVANRTTEKACALAAAFSAFGNIEAAPLNELNASYDLIINGTSASLNNSLPNLPNNCLAHSGIVYDMMYADEPTAFVKWGMQQGASQALDGLGMLIEQAAEAFYIWRGVRPETKPIRALLRQGR